jgi:tetratricopeptide (TPR) repeat protein
MPWCRSIIACVDARDADELLNLAEEVSRHAYMPDAVEWTSRLDERASALPAAVDTLLTAGDEDAALRLVASLRIYAQDSGRVDEVRSLADDLVERVGHGGQSEALARVELVRGELSFRQGDQESATEATRAARTLAASVGDRLTQGRAELNLARIAFRDGDAERIAAHARAAADAVDDTRVQLGAVHMLGWAAYTAGDTDGAILRFEETARAYAERGDRVGLGGELANLGDLALEQGDMERARAYLEQALDVGVETDSRYLIPGVLMSVANFAGDAKRYEQALELAAAAEIQYKHAGLTPDPGTGIEDDVRGAAISALGRARADGSARAGSARSWDEAIELAQSVLAAHVGKP